MAARTLTRGLATKRDAARAVLIGLLKQLAAYVEGIANENGENAASIVESAGMSVVVHGHARREPFDVWPDEHSGVIHLRCKAGPKGCTYYWQISTDEGQTWKDLPPTKQCETSVADLTPGKTYWFRYAILGRRGMGNWSDKKSIVVR